MNKIFAILCIAILLLTNTTVYAKENTAGEVSNALGGIVSYKVKEAGAADAQDWLDGALTEGAGLTSEWYVAGLTNVDGRDFEIDTSFLSDGEWKMVMFCDTPESEKKPETYQIVRRKVRSGDKVPVRMASAGGFIALFVK